MPSKPWAKTLTGAAVIIALTVAVTGCSGKTTGNNTTANTTATGNATATIPPAPKYSGKVVATFTGGKLTKQELDQQYNLQVVLPGQASKEPKSKFVNYYITWYKYLYGKSVKKGDTKVNAKQANSQATQVLSQLASQVYKSKSKMDSKMKSLGVTKADLVRYFAKQQYLQQYVKDQTKNIKVTTKQEQKYYNTNKNQFMSVTVDQILLSTKKKAQAVQKQLQNGAKFATLAVKDSKDPSAKSNKGHFANTSPAQFVAPFAKAAETQPLKKITIVKSQYGYHVLRVDSRTQKKFSAVQSQIKSQLLQTAQQKKVTTVYNNAMKAANINLKVKQSAL